MRVKPCILQHLHLDKTYGMLTGKNVRTLMEYFDLIDVHQDGSINDIQFCLVLGAMTDLKRNQIYIVFDMLDIDGSGQIDFDEFYLLICILISLKDKDEKQFIYRHSRTVFELLDEDGSQSISAQEFSAFGFLFNFYGDAVKQIFNDFDISGDQELDYKEFKMFAMACIDRQNEIDRLKREEIERQKRRREAKALKRLAAGGGTWAWLRTSSCTIV
ncbi:EF-hand calcium-binding domain-containing protein 9-like [Strongylocentrotus purpuratus]|uniref:EF-hand domain-containing protein n=1 Tax=Strongylocentrotus purpuratus TaxID=7668 RepID=A0A7M7GQT5_STRPU|nr:EF-hand calcium-binding domain-containing protein 9-like [Strongylocentrotus purpuratus]|eukprot:XP_003728906.1 PREDICTED: EF-hand calcium-binding domain-containing protein 9-like [Strongylocentrotus purpuratus]